MYEETTSREGEGLRTFPSVASQTLHFTWHSLASSKTAAGVNNQDASLMLYYNICISTEYLRINCFVFSALETVRGREYIDVGRSAKFSE